MATVARPTLLASSEALANAADATFGPAADTSWEVHSIVVSGACDVKRQADPNDDATFEIGPVTVLSFGGENEVHGLKLELDGGAGARTNHPLSQLVITNTSGGTIDVAIYGVKIT